MLPKEATHATRLNLIAKHVVLNAQNDDILIFLDSDAFPVRSGWDLIVSKMLTKTPVVAIRRSENWDALSEKNEDHPHCSFIATTKAFWEANKMAHDDSNKCCGWNIGEKLKQLGYRYTALERTNAVNLHPLMFGIYGDIIYHHGGGSRLPYDGIDVGARPKLKVGTDLDIHYPNILEFNGTLSELVFNKINTDDKFILNYLAGVPDETF